MSEIEERLSRLLVELFEVDEAAITPSSRFREDLGADSLQIVELILLIEETFGITLHDADEHTAAVGDLIDFIKIRRSDSR